MDNSMDGFYIAPAFMDKVVIHITKNFMQLPNINPIMMSAGDLESGNAGEPAKQIRQRYREAADMIAKGKMCCLFINDLDAGAGRMGTTTQYTVNNQMVNATLMNIADNPPTCSSPGCTTSKRTRESPSSSLATTSPPCTRHSSEMAVWRSSIGPPLETIALASVLASSGLTMFLGRMSSSLLTLSPASYSIDFFGAIRARVYEDEVRKWVKEVGIENVGKKLVNSKEGPPKFPQPKMSVDKLVEYGRMLVQEQDNVKRVQLADKYLSDAALGDAITTGYFYGKAAQQVNLPVPQGCTDPGAANFDPTARSDDGSCVYKF